MATIPAINMLNNAKMIIQGTALISFMTFLMVSWTTFLAYQARKNTKEILER